MPVVSLRGKKHVLLMPELAGVDRALLKKPVESVANHREEIVAALDLLFTGV